MTAPDWGLRINGRDSRELGFWLEAKPGFDGRGSTPASWIELPDSETQFLVGRRSAGRTVRYRGRLLTDANTAAARKAAQRELGRVLRSGPLVLESYDGITEPYLVEGVVTSDPIELVGGPERAALARVEFVLEAAHGTFRVRQPNLLVLGPTARVVELGDAPSHWDAWVYGPGTGVELVFWSGSNLELLRLPLGDLEANEWLHVSSAHQTVTEVVSGAPANGLARIGDAPFPPAGLSPYDGPDQAVQLDGGATGVLEWTRRML